MQNLKDQLLRAGLASEEQVQKAEDERRQREARDRFEQSRMLRDFLEAHPLFRAGLGRGLPPDTRVIPKKYLRDESVFVRRPDRRVKFETGYGSPYCGDILVVGIEKSGETARFPTDLNDSGKKVREIGQGNFQHFAVVHQHEDHVVVYVDVE